MVSLQEYIRHIPSQHNIGCCAASSALLCAEILMYKQSKEIQFSRLFNYYMTRKLQGRLGQPGAELRSTFESLSIHGVCRENNWPFFVHKSEKEPSFGAIAEALEFKVTSFEYVNPKNFNTMIDLKIPISIGLQTGRMFWKLHGPISTQEYKPVNLVDNRGSRGHAVTVIGYDNSICGGAWIIANSIGPKWGDKGYGILPYECYRDIGEAYCITGFADLPPSEKNFNN